MTIENPHKKRKMDLQLESNNNSSSDEMASSAEEMAVDTSKTTNGGSTAHDKSKQRAASIDDHQKLTHMYEYKSNVFRMETDELLAETKVDYQKRMGPVEKVLHKLKSIIDKIPGKEPALIAEAEKEMIKRHKVVIPFPNPRPGKDIKYKFAYEKPSYLNVVGSFAMRTMVRETDNSNVDFVLQMPSTLFQEKDYLNYRYFYKRAYYLACLAAGIAEAADFKANLSFGLLNGDSLRPVLLISPSRDGGEFDFNKSKCIIRIIPCVTPDVFPRNKLGMSKNCVRPTNQLDGIANINLPTPTYNSSVLADSTYFAHLKLLFASASHCAAFRDACILGRIWLRQRGFTSDVEFGGFGNFEWSALMAYLLKVTGAMGGSILGGGYSNYQLFKATLQFLSTRDLSKDPLFLNGSGEKIDGCEIPVLMDAELGLNLLFKMSPWSYNMLRNEADLTLQALNSSAQDQFDAIFLNRVDEPCLRYDLIVNVPIATETASLNSTDVADPRVAFTRRLYKVLLNGLSDRVSFMTLKLPPLKPWDIKTKGGELSEAKHATVGLFLHGDKCHRLIDHGPPAENKRDAAAFRKFWGEKSELRRFKDGSILESVFWGNDKDSKSPILHQVISYVVQQHFSPQISQGIIFIGDEYAQLLSKHQLPGAQATTKLFQPVMSGYESFVRDLRAIEDLPLIIRQITPISAALRFSTTQCPLPSLDSGVFMAAPADVALQFESSGRWPDDLLAIQRTKIAFLLRIGQLLEEKSGGNITIRVGLENQEPGFEIFNLSFLDVIYNSGLSFRVRIHHEREPYLLERRSKDKTLAPHTRNVASQALAVYNRTFTKSPLHTTCIAKLCHRHAFLSPTIRLVKKWFAAHLLASHFSEELLELFVVRSFVTPYPWNPPSSVMTGFLRTLEYLANWDWRVDPLIVDTSDGDATATDNRVSAEGGLELGILKATDIESITGRFEALRRSDPGLNRTVLFAATNYDHEGVTWTENGPSRVVAARMTMLARSAVDFAKKHGTDGSVGGVGTLFTHPLTDYDFVIHLNQNYLPGSTGPKRTKTKEFKNLTNTNKINQIGFDPAGLFLKDLSKLYTSTLVFFHGSHTTSHIGCLWAPHTSTLRPWKVNLPYSTIPIADDNGDELDSDEESQDWKGMLAVNKPAIINEIARLGGELVAKIDINR